MIKKLPGYILFFYSSIFSIVFFGLNGYKAMAENRIEFLIFLAPLPLYFIYSFFAIIKNPRQVNYIPNNKMGFGGAGLVLLILIGISLLNLNSNSNAASTNNEHVQSPVIFKSQAYDKRALKIILDEEQDSVEIKKWPSDDSEVMEKAFGENKYYYVLKQDGWYKIILNNNQFGWINEQNAIELE